MIGSCRKLKRNLRQAKLAMAAGRIRSTRRLRCWMVDQVNSGGYRGLIWDDDAKTMFRIPWKHAGKQDFRSEEDGAIFKAWAMFKGKLSDGDHADPASWKTRLRCALNKSPEFQEVNERSQLDISEPYKVYRLIPLSEQVLGTVTTKGRARARGRKRKSSGSDSEEEDVEVKQMKEEVSTSLPVTQSSQETEESVYGIQQEHVDQPLLIMKSDGTVNEIQLNVTIETNPPPGAQDSYHVFVKYLGREVLKCKVMGSDVRIAYQPQSPVPPTPVRGSFPRINLPEPPSTLTSSPGIGPQLQALSTLLPFMERGLMLTSTVAGVYAKRHCQGRIFWTGPHSATAGPHKMNRAQEPVKLFDKDVFRMELDQYRSCGGDQPRCDITLCFGEEFSDMEDPSSKLIITQIKLPWAEQLVKEAEYFRETMTLLRDCASQSGDVTINLVPIAYP
ncbi:hypothetical protein DPEC_G00077770 [Dallia pectoralis]|uniref:Uncharacterized protein n=1 Tax=Dallia pectoralis TaxID=75939 RepID=A0ACC2H3X5_DALPE|nr:hypothetical protein DPEC_G00077770 [Dallia pectoralis]